MTIFRLVLLHYLCEKKVRAFDRVQFGHGRMPLRRRVYQCIYMGVPILIIVAHLLKDGRTHVGGVPSLNSVLKLTCNQPGRILGLILVNYD